MIRVPRPEPLAIAGPAGRIEALLEQPEGSHASRFGVICHPHPLHGGTMHNKVVHTLARALHDVGVPTLRFNYRGVGASEGHYAEGVGEANDALAVTAWGRDRWPNAAPWLLGFSFGGAVAVRAGSRANARLLVLVAPAVGRMTAAAAPHLGPAAAPQRGPAAAPQRGPAAAPQRGPACPWLIIQGDADEVIDPGSVLEWVARESQALEAASLPVPVVRVLHGAGHFFHGRLPELREAVVAFVGEAAAQGSGGPAQERG